MRVVGGKWKSRKINQLLKNDHYSIIRPTTDRIRENIFNIIQNLDVKDQIEGAICTRHFLWNWRYGY